MSESKPAAFFHPLPPLVVAVALVLAGVEAVLQLGAHGLIGGPEALGWRLEAMARLGFSAPLFEAMLARRAGEAADLARFLSYGLVHASVVHALFGIVLLLALGKAVAEAFSAAAMAAIMLASLVAGAIAYGLVLESRVLLVGAYPAVYGLIGAFTWGLWRKAEGRGRLIAFRLVGVLLALQIGLRLVFETGDEWVAEAAGFAAGFALAFVVAPDGRERLRRWRERLRG